MVAYNERYEMAVDFVSASRWIDEVLLVGEDEDKAVLRLMTFPRYKTSGLSGSEWRISFGWQAHQSIRAKIQGDCEPARQKGWWNIDAGYRSIDAGCAALFPTIFSNLPEIFDLQIQVVDFRRKGRLLYRSTYDDKPMPLLVCAGHLPWALIMAGNEPLGTDKAWNDMRHLCFQDGCREKAVSTYRLKYLYGADGEKKPALAKSFALETLSRDMPLVRRFCRVHLRRGNCGLEDADDNYVVLDGPGPDKAVGWDEYTSESSVVFL